MELTLIQNIFFSWLPTYSWQLIFLLVLCLLVCLPYFLLHRRLRSILNQQKLWLDLEQTISELTPEACHYYPNPSRHVLQSVLANQKGFARAGAVGPALDYLAAELDSPIGLVRSLSYLSILVGLLGTVSLLALALQSVDAIGQFKIEQLKNIYPLNAVAIGLAVALFLSYSWSRYQGDQFLLQVSRVLGRLRVDQLGSADPGLLATLEKVGEKFKDWGNEIQEHHRREINHLVQEVRALGESIRQVVIAAIADRQEDDRTLIPLLLSQDAKLELLNQRLYQNYQLLAQVTGSPDDFPKIDPGSGEPVQSGSKPRESRIRRKTGFLSRYFK
jgi:hypothetical protein